MNAAATRGLGKGLSALMGEGYSQTVSDAPESSNNPVLPIGKIRSGKYQPRTLFSEDQLRELSESILKNGVMQPILVRPSGDSDGRYEIIAGERRWRAAKMAGLDAIPVIIRDITDQQALEFALVENIQRQDLTPLEEASGYQRLMDEFAYTQEELSTTVGKSRSHIANFLRLLTLPEDVKSLLDEDALSVGHARALLNSDKPADMAKEIVRRGLNVRQTENLIRAGLPPIQSKSQRYVRPGESKPSRNQNAGPKDADLISLEESLSENLGLKVSINDRGQNGEIVIEYNSLSQLDEVLRRLGGSI